MAKDHSTTSAIQRIPFHDDELLAIVDERTGKEYVLPKPMVDMFGLDWSSQRRKLKTNQVFAKGVVTMTLPSSGGQQETLLLERRLIHAWLLSINSGRVSEAYQKKLLRYQDECADVLDAYFTKKQDTQVMTTWDMLAQMVEMGRQRDERIKALEAAHAETQTALITQQQHIIEAQEAALMALRSMQWVTIRQYVQMDRLQHQMAPSEQRAYAMWLTNYCQERGMAMYKAATADSQWPYEKTYCIAVIQETLEPWLRRRQSQIPLDGTDISP